MKKIQTYIALTGILAIGLFLRLYHNTDISLWHDEAFSALLIKYPWGEMFYRIGLDVHPPVYYMTLRLWSYGLGDNLLSLRGFSVFFGLLTALTSYAFVKAAFRNTKAALIAALLVTVSPFQIQYATEARMYTFGAFLAILAAYLLVRALHASSNLAPHNEQPPNIQTQAPSGGSAWWVGFGFVGGLATLTHYYLLFTVAMLCAYAFGWHIYYYRLNFKKYTRLMVSYAVLVCTFAPWFKWFLYQYKQVGAGYWIPPLDKWSIPTTIWQMFIGTEIGLDVRHTGSQALIILATLFSLFIFIQGIRKTKNVHTWLVLSATLAPFAGSLLFALLAKLKGQDSSVYLVRYFLYAATFYAIAMAVWFSTLKNDILRYTLLGLYIVACLATFGYYWKNLDVQTKPGMAAAVRYMSSHLSPADKLYVGSSFEFFNLKYYLSQVQPPEADATTKPTMASGRYSLEDLSEDTPPPVHMRGWPKPLLFSGGQTTTHTMPHFAGTAILTDADLLPYFEQGGKPGDIVWLLWTNGFGGSKPTTPANWKQLDEHGFADVRPYVGTWIIVTKYIVN